MRLTPWIDEMKRDMRYISSKSILTDPYRAGLEIGPISPEVILLFASMSYALSTETHGR